MKKCAQGTSPYADILIKSPAYPKTASQVIRLLKQALDTADRKESQKYDQREFAQLIGAPKSTIHDWYYGQLPKPILYFICALERLPDAQKLVVLRNLCRELLTLDHPLLSHDKQMATLLKGLLSQAAGLTILTGMETSRNFLFTALGNTACQIVHLRFIAGLDFRSPIAFVPTPGVQYCPQRTGFSALTEALENHWTSIERSPAKLVLLNSVWTLMPSWRNRILALSQRRHVILADNIEARSKGLFKSTTTIIGVSSGQKGLIQISLQAPQP